MKCHGQDWEPGQTTVGFLNVGRQTTQVLALVIGTLDLVNQASPKMGCLVILPVAMDVGMTPFIGQGEHVPGLKGAKTPIGQAEHRDGSVITSTLWVRDFG
jgi:hypothetical protein